MKLEKIILYAEAYKKHLVKYNLKDDSHTICVNELCDYVDDHISDNDKIEYGLINDPQADLLSVKLKRIGNLIGRNSDLLNKEDFSVIANDLCGYATEAEKLESSSGNYKLLEEEIGGLYDEDTNPGSNDLILMGKIVSQHFGFYKSVFHP